MWLLPALARVSALAVRIYYRSTFAGPAVPRSGPVLLVANHPNSLLDPAMVAAAARRPVRFLAKAPLFSDAGVGWLVRAAGAVPVFRRADDPALMGRNEEAFRAAFAALAEGSAMGIFPEGISHSDPSLAPLKTGAARIALGAAALLGGSFPLVPVGLSFRSKERFRSEALAVTGEPVRWDDLGSAGPESPAAVSELTRRIEEALRDVTVNLEHREDAPVVESAERVILAELGYDPAPAERIRRARAITEALGRLRRDRDPRWASLASDVARHNRVLRKLGLGPADLRGSQGRAAALLWTARRLLFFAVAVPLGAAGAAIFWLPYRATGLAEARARPSHDIRSTYKALVGAALFGAWILLLAGGIAFAAGPWAGVAALLALPGLGLTALALRDEWAAARADARRFLVVRRRAEQVSQLRQRQHQLALRLRALWEELQPAERGDGATPVNSGQSPPRKEPA